MRAPVVLTHMVTTIYQVEVLHRNLCRLAVAALAAFADEVQTDSTGAKNLPQNATVHVITSNTLR